MSSSSTQRSGPSSASPSDVACLVVGVSLVASGSIAGVEGPSSSLAWGAMTLTADASASATAELESLATPWTVDASLVPLAWRMDVQRAADLVDRLLVRHFGEAAWSELREDVDDGGVFYVVRTELPVEEAMRRFDELEAEFLADPPHPEMRVALSYV